MKSSVDVSTFALNTFKFVNGFILLNVLYLHNLTLIVFQNVC